MFLKTTFYKIMKQNQSNLLLPGNDLCLTPPLIHFTANAFSVFCAWFCVKTWSERFDKLKPPCVEFSDYLSSVFFLEFE